MTDKVVEKVNQAEPSAAQLALREEAGAFTQHNFKQEQAADETKLPTVEIRDRSKDETEAKATEKVAEELGKRIFEAAANAKAGDSIPISIKGHDGTFDVDARLKVSEKGKPDPIVLGDKPVTVTPAMSEGAFDALVLKVALTQAREGEFPHYFPIKLSLPGQEQLTGKLVLHVPLKGN